MAGAKVILLVTRDTKAAEADYLINALARHGLHTHVVNTAMRARPGVTKVELMTRAVEQCTGAIQALIERGARAIVGLGGGTGSWIAMNAMQTAPFGVPKVMVSTLAFDPRDFTSAADIIVIPSVADIMGLNPTLRAVLNNCAAAVAGMVQVARVPDANTRRGIGLTALGVTSDGALALRDRLEAVGYEVTAFHANGFGGRAFERWIRRSAFHAVIDFTTHELNSALFGGFTAAGPDRLTAAGAMGLPQIVVPGGLDFHSRDGIDSLPPAERVRKHYRQNIVFTHLRATADEMRQSAVAMAERLNAARGPVRVVVPSAGFSKEGAPGGAIHDPLSDAAFVESLRRHLGPRVPLFEEPHAINDPAFAELLTHHLSAMLSSQGAPMHVC